MGKAVNNGESAIREMEKQDFDVVVLDLKMPGMDGITTLAEIKKTGTVYQDTHSDRSWLN